MHLRAGHRAGGRGRGAAGADGRRGRLGARGQKAGGEYPPSPASPGATPPKGQPAWLLALKNEGRLCLVHTSAGDVGASPTVWLVAFAWGY